jgi:hypothetical protein
MMKIMIGVQMEIVQVTKKVFERTLSFLASAMFLNLHELNMSNALCPLPPIAQEQLMMTV